MARHTAGSSGPITQLEDFTQYPAKVAGWKLGEEGQYGRPCIVDLQLSANEDDILSVWLGVKLGQQKNGNVAAFRRFLNAVAGKPEREPIEWFDDETGEFMYRNGEIHELKAGVYVKIRGKREASASDPSKVYYNVLEYGSARKPETPAAFPQALPERVAEPTTDEVPW